jgi:putrescine aminotransferase
VTDLDVLDAYQAHISRSLARMYRLLGVGDEVHAEGPWVWSSNGRRYLDFGGYGVFLLGHRHPAVVGALRACLENGALSSRAMPNQWTARAAALLTATTGGHLGKVMFTNSGAEAVEFAMKAAVKATGRRRFAALEGAFHGKTLGALSLTHARHYRHGWEPTLQAVRHFRAGDTAIEDFLATGDVAAVVVEPIQAERGVVTVDPAWIRKVAAAARASGTVFVVDEVSTGCGRTGRFWCSEGDGILDSADIVLSGKALGGGVAPIGAALVRPEIFEPFDADPLLHTSTFGGNPLACAAAAAVVETVDQDCLAQVRRKGEALRQRLRATAGRWPLAAVRGDGLLIGLEFASEGGCGLVAAELLERRILTVPALGAMKTLRITPPVVVADDEIERFFGAFEESVVRAEKDRKMLEAMEE